MQRSTKRVSSSNLSAKTNEDSANKRLKKSATVQQQSNTLFNYFVSNRKIDPKPAEPKQSSIFTYFKSESQSESKKSIIKPEFEIEPAIKNEVIPIFSDDEIEPETIITKKEDIFSEIQSNQEIKPEEKKNFLSLFNRPNIKAEVKQTDPDEIDYNTPSNVSSKENRKCPFYKKIENTKIVVDAFSYGIIENVNAYFLSHFHYDHFIGLNKHFNQTMYCSQITANLVIKQIKVEKRFIRILEYNKFVNVYDNDNDIQVCLIDANHRFLLVSHDPLISTIKSRITDFKLFHRNIHDLIDIQERFSMSLKNLICPGSVMFLFRLNKLKKYILHTGDFRASKELVNDLFARSIKIDVICLDTTYLDSYYKFLPQSDIIKLGIDLVRNELSTKPNALIVCGSYTIGKERIFIGIAESLNLKIYVTKDKKTIIDCLNDPSLNKRITLNPSETNLHVIPMGKLNIKDLESYASKFDKFDHVIALKPSGWTHDAKSSTDGLCVVKKSKNIIIYGLEYSEHSSFAELENFIRTIRPKKVIPHVNVGKKETREKMQSYISEWLSPAN